MEKNKFNWLAFFFNSSYYVGKGKTAKGLFFLLFTWMPLFAIIIGIYCGFRANKELGDATFSWGKAIVAGIIQCALGLIVLSIKK